jgi:hypothetical protein
VPLFTKGGEFQGSASLQPDFLAERVAGFDAQGALSVSNHLAIIGNFSYCRYNNSNERSRRHKFFEGGVGYFQNKGRFAYQVFAGYGRGEGFGEGVDGKSNLERASGQFHRFFIQPAFIFNNKALQLSFSPRITVVDFTEYTSDIRGRTVLSNPHPKVFIEPAVMGRLNLLKNRMFVTGQTGISIPVSKVEYDYQFFNISVGIGLHLGGVKKETE